MKISIRLAMPEDAEYCADIHAKSWSFAYNGILSTEIINVQNFRRPMMWTKLLANNTDSHYVITYNNTIIGFFTIAIPRDNDLKESSYEIVGLYLTPDYVGAGYGHQAMEWIKTEIQCRGYNKICLWVLEDNNRARRFYEKSGFRTDGKIRPSGLDETQEIRYIFG